MTSAKEPRALGGIDPGYGFPDNRIGVSDAPVEMPRNPSPDLDPASKCDESVPGTHADVPRVGGAPHKSGAPSSAFPPATPA